ncbi:FAD binding domain-containing protein [Paratissierella segnis]|jgi:CO/xanthine dehydrogenase FAD-binding subunit|uniref:FAD binding domain-containing protein n=1 Tax=Paratissierella segnis TaxID=2763679 RepID=A0A926EW48_9FIRM|nr:FAD binding domain-containing protein [Paratissierella segnis]MBC8589403.1 FAD binding domain-containing protein [Paratissierella segnis]
MIPFEFEYYKPDTVEEAVNLYDSLSNKNKKVIYYGGGTEFISMARRYNMYADAVIDIKAIPECNEFDFDGDDLYIGSAVSLSQIADINKFPLLSLVVKRIADHTIQDKITLGGNIIGTIIYKESILPLLIANSDVVLENKTGKRRVSLNKVFNKKLLLDEGEMLVQVIVKKEYVNFPYQHVKRTKNEKIDYPLLSVSALKDNDTINVAFSGLCEYPFRAKKIEKILNEDSLAKKDKIDEIIKNIPGEILHDVGGTKEYRKFMLGAIISEILDSFQEEE